jgi:UDP-2-acetamido-3-amino-2,3-dideoxy-glucuronate N-acetyltransferase
MDGTGGRLPVRPDEGANPISMQQNPGMPPRTAVVGCGYWGRHIARNVHALGALAAICERNEARGRDAAARYGVPVRSLAEILDDPTIDAVMVALPIGQHFRAARAALEAGKHLFVEKPIALSLAETVQLQSLAERRGVVLMAGHLLRYHPAVRRWCALIREGAVGRLRHVQAHRQGPVNFRREDNVFWSFAPHDVSVVLSLVDDDPVSVVSIGASFEEPEVCDAATIHLGFPDGTTAHVFLSWLHPLKEQSLTAYGDRGMLVFDDLRDWDSKIVLHRQATADHDGAAVPVPCPPEPVPTEPGEPLRLECEHFLGCVASGDRPITDGTEALRVMRVLDGGTRIATSAASQPCAGLRTKREGGM